MSLDKPSEDNQISYFQVYEPLQEYYILHKYYLLIGFTLTYCSLYITGKNVSIEILANGANCI